MFMKFQLFQINIYIVIIYYTSHTYKKFNVFLKMRKSEPVLQIPIYPLDQQFTSFAKYNDSKSDGKRITIQQLDLWFLQAEIIDYKRVTHTDTGVYFNRFK